MGFGILKTLKGIFLWIDRMVAWAIDAVYSLLIQIANVSVFSDETLNDFKQRIGIMLGLFMLFKIAISMINYVINPESMSDNSKGASKLVLNIVVSLVMLVTYDYVFTKAFELQNLVLEHHVLERVLLGSSDPGTVQVGYSQEEEKKDNTNIPSAADPVKTSGLSFYVYSSFVRPSEHMFDNIKFKKNDEEVSAGEQSELKRTCRYGVWSNDVDRRKVCLDAIKDAMPNNWVNDGEYGEYDYAYATAEGKVYENSEKIGSHQELFDAAVVLKSGQLVLQEDIGLLEWGWTWRTDYYILIPTAIGIIVLLTLVGFCFDVGVRAVKLGFLRLIAPVPIIAYMDIGKGKDIFNKWLKQCINTFLSIFIRLIGLYFAIFVISEIVGNGIRGANNERLEFWDNPFVIIFIILGALTFAKQLPKLIQDITGINLDGGKFTLNPLKKSPVAAGAVAAGAAIGGSMARNMALRGQQLKEKMKNAQDGEKLKTLGKGALGMLGGLGGSFRGARGAFKGAEKDGIKGASKGAIDKNTRRTMGKLSAEERGYGVKDRAAEGARRFFGLRTQSEMLDNEIERLNRIEQENAIYDEALSRVDKEKENLDKIYKSDMELNTLLAGIDAAKRSKDPKQVESAQKAFVNALNKKMYNDTGFRDRVNNQTDRINNAIDSANEASKKVKDENGDLKYAIKDKDGNIIGTSLEFKKLDKLDATAFAKATRTETVRDSDGKYVRDEHGNVRTRIVEEYTGYTTQNTATLDGSTFNLDRTDIGNAIYENQENFNYRQKEIKSQADYVKQQGRAKSYDDIHGNK